MWAFLLRFGPALAVVLAPLLVRGPAWLLGISLDPLWPTANLLASGQPPLAPGLPGFMDMEHGWTTQALGSQAAAQWLSGRIPWWDPFSGVGLPLAAEMQSSALFLPYVLLFALPGGATLFAVALQVTAGLATLALLRGLGLSRVAATTGAIVFQLGGTFAWIGAPCGLPNAFLPLFLLGIERARTAAIARGGYGFRLVAAAIALSLYAGFPETAYLNGLLALVWAAFRLLSLPGADRVPFAWRVAAGGCCGLAIAAPILVTFSHLLAHSTLGAREHIDMGLLYLPPPGNALYAMPYVLGPLAGYSGVEPSGWMTHLWGRVGGYLGVPLAMAAAIGLVSGRRRERGLRVVLGVWILACFVRSASVPWAKDLWEVVPFISQVQFFRYSGGSWMMAACVLAAFAVDDLRVRTPARGWAWGIGGALAAGTAVSLAGGWSMVEGLLAHAPGYTTFLAGSIGWAAATLAVTLWLLDRRGPGRPWLAGLLVLDAAVLFAVPLFSGVRQPKADDAAVAFLRANVGMHRFYTLGPFQPNYGAMFGVASLNHNYLPVPSWWPEYIRANLDEGADPVLFMGNYPPATPGRPSRLDALRQNLDAFAQLGVAYVLTEPGVDLATPTQLVSQVSGPNRVLPLPAGGEIAFTVPPGLARSGAMTGVQLALATYAGAASGTLRATACSAGACRSGRAELAGAPDGEDLAVPFESPLPVGEGAAVEITLAQEGGSPAAVWLWPNPGRAVTGGGAVVADHAPRLSLRFGPSLQGVRLERRTASMNIWSVAGAAPYFEPLDAGCRAEPRGREAAAVTCERPSSLRRRELWYPGWRATLNGASVPVGRDGKLFQRVDLPAGTSLVAFHYQPPWMGGFMSLAVLGVAGLVDIRRRRPPR